MTLVACQICQSNSIPQAPCQRRRLEIYEFVMFESVGDFRAILILYMRSFFLSSTEYGLISWTLQRVMKRDHHCQKYQALCLLERKSSLLLLHSAKKYSNV